MISFKERYISEAASYHKDMAHLISLGSIPLLPEVLEILGHKSETKKVFHATSMEYLPQMKQLGRTKKQISTFTDGLSSIMVNISVKPEVLCVLEGKAELISDHDIFSHPDPKGLRWIKSRGTKKSDFFLEAILNRTIKEMDRLGKFKMESKTKESLVYDDYKFEEYFHNMDNKKQTSLIKFYKDNILDLMKNKMYTDILSEILALQKTTGSHNEIIMSKFTVTGVYSLEGGMYQFDQSLAEYQIEKSGYKYLGHIDKSKFNSIEV